MNTICRLISTAITLSFILTLSAQLVCGSSISASTGSNKCITQIQYNHLNLPSRITYSNGRWSGAFTLTPGHGYVYYSKATQSRTLSF